MTAPSPNQIPSPRQSIAAPSSCALARSESSSGSGFGRSIHAIGRFVPGAVGARSSKRGKPEIASACSLPSNGRAGSLGEEAIEAPVGTIFGQIDCVRLGIHARRFVIEAPVAAHAARGRERARVRRAEEDVAVTRFDALSQVSQPQGLGPPAQFRIVPVSTRLLGEAVELRVEHDAGDATVGFGIVGFARRDRGVGARPGISIAFVVSHPGSACRRARRSRPSRPAAQARGNRPTCGRRHGPRRGTRTLPAGRARRSGRAQASDPWRAEAEFQPAGRKGTATGKAPRWPRRRLSAEFFAPILSPKRGKSVAPGFRRAGGISLTRTGSRGIDIRSATA